MKNFKTLIVSAILVACGMNLSADNKNNLIHNAEEVDGIMVSQTIYKNEGSRLANFMKYNYQYDEQKRMTESEAMKWNSISNKWENDMCIRYEYKGKSVTTTYYKWNKKKATYVLVPEMTVTMDNTNM